jgi:hypothetical protein
MHTEPSDSPSVKSSGAQRRKVKNQKTTSQVISILADAPTAKNREARVKAYSSAVAKLIHAIVGIDDRRELAELLEQGAMAKEIPDHLWPEMRSRPVTFKDILVHDPAAAIALG